MYTLLSLGDSYTIGEGVLLTESFPYSLVQQLRSAGFPFAAPEIIARTGWTTDELSAAMEGYNFLPRYDFVTLLIGVNNQYRGRPATEYAVGFEALLQTAIRLAGTAFRVFVLSIPDWGLSPFAMTSRRDTNAIRQEIDLFNKTAETITTRHNVVFLDITSHGRDAGSAPENFTTDGLHPAKEFYAAWAVQIASIIQTMPLPR